MFALTLFSLLTLLFEPNEEEEEEEEEVAGNFPLVVIRYTKNIFSQMWWCMPLIRAVRENSELKASLVSIASFRTTTVT